MLRSKRRIAIFVVSCVLIISSGVIATRSRASEADIASQTPLDSAAVETVATNSATTSPIKLDRQNIVKVTRVIDGDTIVVEGSIKVRYIGVDTPETVDPRRPVGCFGKEASNFNKQLVEGKMVRLEKDVSETDKFGRLLRYVYLQTDNGEIFVNDTLARQGYAMVKTYPPDVKYQDQFLQAQQEARQNNRGLWSKC